MSYNTCDACEPCAPAPAKPKVSEMTKELTMVLNEIDLTLGQIRGLVSDDVPHREPPKEPCCIAENAFINLGLAKGILDNVLRLKEDL